MSSLLPLPLPAARFGVRGRGRGRSGSQQGSAVIVVMVLLAILLIYVASNLRVLHNLDRELRLVERREVRRLVTATHPATNPAATTNTVPVLEP